MKLLSIVILNWNGAGFLKQFLQTLINHSQLPGVEVVVADNASTDASLTYLAEKFSDIRVIKLNKNYGFAGGYNRALEQIDSKYYLLLNSDIEVPEGWLKPLVSFMEKYPEVAACGPKILDYNKPTHFEYAGASGGFIDRYGYPFCRGRIFDALEEDKGQHYHSVDVFWASGAALLVRSEAYWNAGGLDEDFFAHMEEIDLCWRLKNRGHRIAVVPASCVYHVGGGSLPRGNPFKTYLNFRNNLFLMYKNLPNKGFRVKIFVRLILDGISSLRFLLGGDLKDFGAVLRAHLAFYKGKRRYKPFRKENKTYHNYVTYNEIYPGSVVLDFFLLRNRQIDRLRKDFSRNMCEAEVSQTT